VQEQQSRRRKPWCLETETVSTTVVMALAATCGALIAVFGEAEHVTVLTVTGALFGLVPWALEAGGIKVRPLVFMVATFVPAAMIVLVDRNPGGMFPVMLAVVWLTRADTGPLITIVTVVLGAAIAIGLAVLEGTTHETGAVYFIGGLGVAWLAGTMLRRQEVLIAELQEAHERQTEHAAADERTRIAREVHDVVAHSLTVTMLHVTGARRALGHDPGRAAEALERAETVGRESLDSIRQVVGLLRSPGGGDAQEAPLPVLADIPGLVDQYRHAGMSVRADVAIDGVAADATTALTAYRVVQEALSNSLQHAPGAPIDLEVGTDTGGTVLRIVAENPTTVVARRDDRVGLGLRGMAERVRAAGGSVEAGATERSTWRIEAALPMRRAATQP
jgi:signal transduction histidine kinase